MLTCIVEESNKELLEKWGQDHKGSGPYTFNKADFIKGAALGSFLPVMQNDQQLYVRIEHPAGYAASATGDAFSYAAEQTITLGFFTRFVCAPDSALTLADFLESLCIRPLSARAYNHANHAANSILKRLHASNHCLSDWYKLTTEGVQSRYDCATSTHGVIIVDAVTRKYCYVNATLGRFVSDLYPVSNWDPYVAHSASEYVRLHSPADKHNFVVEMETIKIMQTLDKYEVMTQRELELMYPDMYKPVSLLDCVHV